MESFIYHENSSGNNSFRLSTECCGVDDKNSIFVVASSPLRFLTQDTKGYPYDDVCHFASTMFCESFIKHINEKFFLKKFDTDALKKILLECNKDIANLNTCLDKSYGDLLNYDVAEAVGIGAVIKDGVLYYGGLEDCYINILRGEELKNVQECDYQLIKSKSFMDKYSTDDKLEEYVPNELKDKLKHEHHWEAFWCNYLRNNVDALDNNGSLVGYGCFTGEEEVEKFVHVHSTPLEDGDHILLFSNGMVPILDSQNFLKWFTGNVKNTYSFQRRMRENIEKLLDGKDELDNEKTLVYLKYNDVHKE